MQEKLLNCPFCGGEAEITDLGFGPVDDLSTVEFVTVSCNCGGLACGNTKAEAIAAWNHRPSPWTRLPESPEEFIIDIEKEYFWLNENNGFVTHGDPELLFEGGYEFTHYMPTPPLPKE